MPLHFINPNLHVILIHYPLGIFVLGVVLELFGFLWGHSSVRIAARWMIVMGALLILPSATSGISALHDIRPQTSDPGIYEQMRLHVGYMGLASIVAVFCAVVGLAASDRWRKILYLPLLLGVIGAWGLMVFGAYNAGESIFTKGTAVNINNPRTVAANLSSHMTVALEPRVDFEKQIQPIIAGTCYTCHAGAKHKGDLQLDTIERIRKGGKTKGARIIVAGSPQSSELYHRIILPKDSDDIMPAKGNPLTHAQTRLIKIWISQGADFGNWKEDKDTEKAIATAKNVLRQTAEENPVEVNPAEIPAETSRLADKPHPDIVTAIKNKDVDELMNYYAGGALQQHLILAGFAFAGAFFALGLSIRRLHSSSIVHDTPVSIVPPEPVIHGQGERRRVAEDVNMIRSFKPGTSVRGPSRHVHAPNHIPSGRMWLLTLFAIIGTIGLGYWMAAGAENILTPHGWDLFVNMLKSDDPAVKINRPAAHAILGASFAGLVLICAMLAAFAPRRPVLLGLFSILLIAVIAAQVWIGVLLTFDKKAKDASLFHFQTETESKDSENKSTPTTEPSTPATTNPIASTPAPTKEGVKTNVAVPDGGTLIIGGQIITPDAPAKTPARSAAPTPSTVKPATPATKPGDAPKKLFDPDKDE